MQMKPALIFVAGLAVLVSLVLVNHVLFAALFQTSYVKWYLSNAPFIGFALAFVSALWGTLDKHPDLISAHPLKYVSSYTRLLGVSIFALGTNVASNENPGKGSSSFDNLMTLALLLLLLMVLTAALIVIAPLQYFMFLVCGAPARRVARSDQKTIARVADQKWEMKAVRKDADVPDGWVEMNFGDKPFTLTILFVTLVTGILKFTPIERML